MSVFPTATKMTSVITPVTATAIKPYASAYINSWKQFLVTSDKQEYLQYLEKGLPSSDEEIEKGIDDKYIDLVHTFNIGYINTVLASKEQQDKFITEYGFRKLINLMCEYNGNEICDELLDFDQYREEWIEMAMYNILNIYT